MTDLQAVSEALNRLFRTYPGFQTDNIGEVVQVYFEAASSYPTEDVLTAIRGFIAGTVPGHNAAFAPSAPQLGAASRAAMNARLDAEARANAFRPHLPPPAIEHDPESQERVKAKMAEAVEKLAATMRTDEAEAERRHTVRAAKVNARFAPDMSAGAVKRRLGFTAGDPDGDRDVA